MTATRRLTATLVRTLETKADQAAPPALAAARVPPPPRRRPPWTAVAAAAVLVVAGVAVAAAVAGTGGGPDPEADIVTVGDPPDGWLVPTWMPAGVDVWAVETRDNGSAAPGGDWNIFQLFGDPSGGRAIYLDAGTGAAVPPDGATPVTVRGTSGWAAPSVDTPDVVDTITWRERDASITVLYKGLTEDEAVAALDALAWRSDAPADGFDAPAGGGLPLRGEHLGGPGEGRYASYLLSEGAQGSGPAAGGFEVSVFASVGRSTPLAYLDHWFWAGEGGGDGPVRSFDPDSGEVRMSWPDGRELYLSPRREDGPVDRAALDRIADSVTLGTAADLAALRVRAAANVATLPVAASAATVTGTLEVRGTSDYPVLCLVATTGHEPGCADWPGSQADWVVDGTWYVGVASTDGTPRVFGDRGERVGDDELPADMASDGPWQLALVAVPADVDQVDISLNGQVSTLMGLPRPG